MNLLEALRAITDPRATAHDWTAAAVCAQVDPGLFFPEKGQGAEPAKAICRTCDVRERCLAEALADPGLTGVWGATTWRERGRLRNPNAHPCDTKEPE